MRTIARRTRPVAVVLSALLLVASGLDDQATDAHHATATADAGGHDEHG